MKTISNPTLRTFNLPIFSGGEDGAQHSPILHGQSSVELPDWYFDRLVEKKRDGRESAWGKRLERNESGGVIKRPGGVESQFEDEIIAKRKGVAAELAKSQQANGNLEKQVAELKAQVAKLSAAAAAKPAPRAEPIKPGGDVAAAPSSTSKGKATKK